MGRAPAKIDWQKFELFLKAGCSQENICNALSITPNTIRNNVLEHYGEDYSTICARFRSTGIALLEAKQMQKALEGSVPMLQWLGKVRLGQKEASTISHDQENLSTLLRMLAEGKLKQVDNPINEITQPDFLQ